MAIDLVGGLEHNEEFAAKHGYLPFELRRVATPRDPSEALEIIDSVILMIEERDIRDQLSTLRRLYLEIFQCNRILSIDVTDLQKHLDIMQTRVREVRDAYLARASENKKLRRELKGKPIV